MKVREKDEDWEDAHNFEIYDEFTEPNDVAEKYAEWLWEYNHCDPEYFDKNIEVMDDEENVHKFSVTAEANIKFYAEEMEDVAEEALNSESEKE